MQMKMIKKSGFSLLEIVMILAIIGVTGYMVAPMVSSSVAAYQLSSEANQLLSRLRDTQQASKAGQIEHGIQVTNGNNCYNIGIWDGVTWTVRETVCMKGGVYVQSSSNFAPTYPARTVVFDHLGMPQGSFGITLRHPSGDTMSVQARVPGRIYII